MVTQVEENGFSVTVLRDGCTEPDFSALRACAGERALAMAG
ncbi:hypothetical protein [Sorangium sp. So ce233]